MVKSTIRIANKSITDTTRNNASSRGTKILINLEHPFSTFILLPSNIDFNGSLCCPEEVEVFGADLLLLGKVRLFFLIFVCFSFGEAFGPP